MSDIGDMKVMIQEMKGLVESQNSKIVEQNGRIDQLQQGLARINAVGTAPAGAFQGAPIPQGGVMPAGMTVVQLTPQQLAAAQADPRTLQAVLPPNGVASAPTPEQPNRLFTHSSQGFSQALVAAKTQLYVGAGVPEQVAAAIAVVEAKTSLEQLRSAGTVVMPDLPRGFEWKWYHVVGVGLLCALVGVGGYWAYGKWFKAQT